MNAYAPQPQQQQQQPPQQQQMFMTPNQQQVFQQQVPQQFVPQQQGGTPLGIHGSSFVPQQQTMMSQQSPQMGQQPFMTNMQPHQQQPVMGNMQQQPMQASYGAPSPANFQQQQTPSIPADILGLADKAASAVQALQASRSSAQVVNMPPQQMMPMQMQGQPMQMQGQPNSFSSYSNSAPSSQPPAFRRGRTTATMSELPVMVQYSVQVSAYVRSCAHCSDLMTIVLLTHSDAHETEFTSHRSRRRHIGRRHSRNDQ